MLKEPPAGKLKANLWPFSAMRYETPSRLVHVTSVPIVTSALGGSKEETLTATLSVGTGAGAKVSAGLLRPEQAEALIKKMMIRTEISAFTFLPHFILSHLHYCQNVVYT
jgi:hypothetical protein